MSKRLSPIVLAVFAVMGVGSPLSALADVFPPSHGCSKPYKPFRITSERELESFKDDVDRYERCIKDFVGEQKDAARAHQEAASEAIDEWNSFVRFELR